MAKKVQAYVKLQVAAGMANSEPSTGSAGREHSTGSAGREHHGILQSVQRKN